MVSLSHRLPLLLAAVLSLLLVLLPPAMAQAPEESGGVAAPTGFTERLGATISLLHSRTREVVRNADDAFGQFNMAVADASPNTYSGWLYRAIPRAGLALLAALAVSELAVWLLARAWLARYPTSPGNRIEQICFLATRASIGILGACLVAVSGLILADIVSDNDPAAVTTTLVILLTAAVVRAVLAVARNLIVPDRPAYRLIPGSQDQISGLWRGIVATILICATALGFAVWIGRLPIDVDAFRLVHIGATFIAMLALASLALRQRRVIANALLGTSGRQVPAWRRLLAGCWHLIALGYFIIAWLVSSARVLLDQPGGIGLVTSPLGVLIAAFGLYGLAIVVIEAAFRNAPAPLRSVATGQPIPSFKNLAEEAAAIVVTILAFATLFGIWGVALFEGGQSLGNRFFHEILIVLIGYLLYQATKIAIDRRLLAESDSSGEHPEERGDEAPGHASATRMGTLLHLFRGFALISIIVLSVMIGLSELGIDIAPLFAGAGVIGLAIGFGAQTLIRDIFSGAFFLIDDAFRRGEYIDIGVAKGTVERISIRSIQLRHQNGPLDTVPFGVIRNVRNFSRDWVIMKLPLRLTFDTDIEQVRKIVKSIGQELAAHPEVGPKFLEPLKSQGVYEIDDSGMVVRVKFMTRPGDQFAVRRMVYARIQERFAEAGIRFASREVMVRVAEGARAEGNSHILGAALPAVTQAMPSGAAEAR